MIYSSGLVLIKNNKILLAHPTNTKWTGTFQIPKGKLEDGEFPINAAIRETLEEVGILVNILDINQTKHEIKYDKQGKIFKLVYYFIADVSKYNLPDILPKEQLQLQEMDYAKFYTKEESRKIIFHRFLPILNHIK